MGVSKGRNRKSKLTTHLKPTKMAAQNTEISRKGKEQSGQIQHSQSFYQGIVPSPEMMDSYKLVDETLPGRLVKLTEDEAIHRRKIETKLTNGSFTSTIIGQIFAFLSVLAVCALSYFFMIKGNPDEGKIIAVSIIIGLAALFLGKNIFKSKTQK